MPYPGTLTSKFWPSRVIAVAGFVVSHGVNIRNQLRLLLRIPTGVIPHSSKPNSAPQIPVYQVYHPSVYHLSTVFIPYFLSLRHPKMVFHIRGGFCLPKYADLIPSLIIFSQRRDFTGFLLVIARPHLFDACPRCKLIGADDVNVTRFLTGSGVTSPIVARDIATSTKSATHGEVGENSTLAKPFV